MADARSDRELYRAPPSGLMSMLLCIGPAIVVSGSVVGSGELINVPVQAAKYGFVLFWAVIISCLIKYFLQVEFGRHCLVHNRTTIQALNHVPGPKIRGTGWVGIVYMVGYSFSLVTLAGILGALAGLLHVIFPLASEPTTSKNIWAVVMFIVTTAVLWRGLYNELETLVSVLVCGFSFSVVVALVLVQGTPYAIRWEEVASGLTFSLGEIDRSGAAFAVISLMGALGVAGNELFMYPYWIIEKGYTKYAGPADSPGWLERARGWIRVLKLDAFCGTLLATVITAAYFLVGCAVLHRKVAEESASVPTGMAVVDQISAIFTETYGRWSYAIFMFGAFCTLFSTLVVAAAATGRMWTDLLSSMGLFDWHNVRAKTWCNRCFQTIYLVAFLFLELFGNIPAEKRVIVGQYIIGLVNTPLLMIAICWLAFKTNKQLRMGKIWAAMLLATVGIILGCVALGLYGQAVN